MVIYNNLPAFSSLRNLQITEWGMARSMERLASGLRVNRAADDASGFAMSEQMRRQVRGISVAQKNALDGISLLQVADAAYSSTLELLQKINELVLSASNSDKTIEQRDALEAEIISLLEEIDLTGTATTYNGKEIVAVGGGASMLDNIVNFQISPEDMSATPFTFTMGLQGTAMSGGISSLTLTAGGELDAGVVDISDADGTLARALIPAVSEAISNITQNVAEIGAYQNRLRLTIDRLGIVQENIKSAESRIRDLDISAEMTNFTRLQILQQSGTAMLAQANMAPQAVLQLLR